MKQFNNLLDAICFQTHCPLCRSELRSDSFTNSNQKIALKLFGNLSDIIYIDVATNNIDEVYVGSGSLQAHANKRGILGQSITISCYDCCMYSFIIQIWIDLDKQSINKILLNSEEVSWEDKDNVLHEITSIYSTNKTKYSYYSPPTAKDDGQIILPFVSVDIYNPKDAVVRIRKLLVFS